MENKLDTLIQAFQTLSQKLLQRLDKSEFSQQTSTNKNKEKVELDGDKVRRELTFRIRVYDSSSKALVVRKS